RSSASAPRAATSTPSPSARRRTRRRCGRSAAAAIATSGPTSAATSGQATPTPPRGPPREAEPVTSDDLVRLRDSVDALRRTVDTRLSEDPVREQAFEKLYAELKDYKDGFVQEAERPLLLDLLLLYDSMNWFHAQVVKRELSPD